MITIKYIIKVLAHKHLMGACSIMSSITHALHKIVVQQAFFIILLLLLLLFLLLFFLLRKQNDINLDILNFIFVDIWVTSPLSQIYKQRRITMEMSLWTTCKRIVLCIIFFG